MHKSCSDCPFSDSVAGTRLRESLRPGRMAEIQATLLRGDAFPCHQSVNYDERDPGSEKICAGAIAWQEARGVVADLVQMMERIEWFSRGKV